MENRKLNLTEDWIRIGTDIIKEGQYIVTELKQSAEGVKISLQDDTNHVVIFFDGVPALLRDTVEGIRLRTCCEIQIKYQNDEIFRKHFFYRVENSSLVDWMIEECCHSYKKDELIHFCIVTSEELLDIVASFDPEISVNE